MEQKLVQIKNLFENKRFTFNDDALKKEYLCTEVDFMAGNFKIITPHRTFVKKDYELDDFIANCVFVEGGKMNVDVVETKPIYPAAVMSNERAKLMSNSLFEMFEKVSSGQAEPRDFENAKTMVSVSNQILNIEKVNLGYLMLKNKQ